MTDYFLVIFYPYFPVFLSRKYLAVQFLLNIVSSHSAEHLRKLIQENVLMDCFWQIFIRVIPETWYLCEGCNDLTEPIIFIRAIPQTL